MATLSQLLALPELALRLVQAGPGDPELSWASTTELLDLGEYLEGGEIVLTTGLALGGGDRRWRDFVASLSRARIAAIGFGVGVSHERIPPPLIAAASAYRVALVEVPPPVPFVAVSKAVAGLLRSDELRAAQRALQVHQRLLDGARGPQSSAEVLAGIAQATGRQLALLGGDGSRIASTAGFAARESASGSDGPGSGAEVISLDEATGTRLVIAEGEPLEPEARAVIAAGAMVLGLEVRGERSEDERERERWARLAEGLLSGELAPESATLLDPWIELPARVRAIAVQGAPEDVSAWRRQPRAGVDRLVTGAWDTTAAGTALAWQLCAADDDSVEQALAAIGAHGLDAVIGRAVDLAGAALSRRSAAARLGSLSTIAQLYAEPRVPAVVRADRGSPMLEALLSAGGASGEPSPDPRLLCEAVLGPLARDGGHGARGAGADGAGSGERAGAGVSDEERTALRETLRSLLARNGQRAPTAAALGVHRNTLRDRGARIERITGRSLDHPDDRAELWLALRLEESLG